MCLSAFAHDSKDRPKKRTTVGPLNFRCQSLGSWRNLRKEELEAFTFTSSFYSLLGFSNTHSSYVVWVALLSHIFFPDHAIDPIV